MTEDDVKEMFKALWQSVNNANTRTKSNQNSLLLIQIVYSEPNKKLYGLDRLIKIDKTKTEKRDEQIRSSEDYTLDFSALKEIASSDKVSAVNFYTEKPDWRNELSSIPKFGEIAI